MGACVVKYMGSKRAMLLNGLGELLSELVPEKEHFFDLFCGGASVAGYVARRFNVSVHAGDLQEYAVALARVRVEQTSSFDPETVLRRWWCAAGAWLQANGDPRKDSMHLTPGLGESLVVSREKVMESRAYCAELPFSFPFARAYGGYYFSPYQAVALDALRATLPGESATAALAALLDGASSCAASPGHTAQPFSVKDSSLPHLVNAWRKDIGGSVAGALFKLSTHVAKVKGRVVRGDAFALAGHLAEGDLAFVDPPYSEVQYSRFYHVLEALALGEVGAVSGVGRYPPISARPQSNYSLRTESAEEFDRLMLRIAASGAEAIVTFPAGNASNGLSGEHVEALSDQYFNVASRQIKSLFSTLGGNARNRDARQGTSELVLHLVPR